MTDTASGHAEGGAAGAPAPSFSEAPGASGNIHCGRWNAARLISLVYSPVLFVVPLQRHSLLAWVGAGLVYLCFLALYLGLYSLSAPRLKVAALIAISLLAIGYMPFNVEASVFLIYVAANVPYVIGPAGASVASIFAASAVTAAEGALLHQTPWAWAIYSVVMLPVGFTSLLRAVRERGNSRLALAQEQIEHLAQVAERERIARDLHDVLGHTLSLIVLKSELARSLLRTDPQGAHREIAELEQTARKALGEVREAVRGYRSDGLAEELARARQTLSLAGITLECAETLPRIDPVAESVLALVLRESVTNIVRHARAHCCRLSVSVDPGGTALRIEDDGRGGIEHEGNGLRGMRERLATLGGRLAIDSQRGTRLTAQIPAQAAAAQAPA